MIVSPENKIILKLATKYCKNFSDIAKRSAIENGASVNLEDLVSIVGEVVSIPKSISKDKWHEGFSTKDIQVGDTAIFSFSIVYDWYQNTHMGDPLYKNLISIQGKEFWMADITKIYAVIRDEKITMINGYVMAKPFEKDIIITETKSKKTKGVKSSRLMYVGNPRENKTKIKAKQGDTIYYAPNLPIPYQINDKPFIILQQHQVLGYI